MESMLVRFKNKDYYVKYDDLLNKATKKLWAYEDPELTKIATINGLHLIFNKEDLEDKLRTGKNDFSDIKMDSPMPGAAKTENINMLGLGSSPEQLEKTKISDKEKFDQEIDKIITSDMGTLVKDIPVEKIEYALKFLKNKVGLGSIGFAYHTNIKKLEKALEHKKKSKIFKENKMSNKEVFKVEIINKNGTSTIQPIMADPNTDELFKIVDLIKKKKSIKSVRILEPNEENKMTNEQKLRKYIREMIIKTLKEDAPYGQPDEDKYLFKTGQDYLAGIQGDSSIDEAEGEPSAEELEAKKKAAEEKAKKQAYQRFFSQTLAKFGYSSPASIPDDKKKSFYDYIDANWTSKQEEPKTEGYADWPNYRDNNNEYYEIDLTKCTHNEAINIIGKLKHKPGIVDVSYSDSIFHTEPEVDLSKYLNPDEMKCIKKRNINETSGTGGIAGYETPRAFTGKKGISKKQKSIANQLGYELVDKSYAVKDQGDVQDLKEGKPITKQEKEIYDEILNILQNHSHDIVPDGTYEGYGEWGIIEIAYNEVASDILELLTNKGLLESKLNESIKLKEINETSIRNTIMGILDDYNVQGTNSMPIDSGIPTDNFAGVVNEIMAVLRRVKPFGESINEGIDSLYLKDENLTPEQKLGLAMRHVRNNLYEVEKVIQKTIKMKNEQSIDSSKIGKRTYSSLKRINEKVIRLMIALQELK